MSAATDAITEVLALANRLPLGVRWSVMITEDTAIDNPAAFNCWVSSEEERVSLRQRLSLGRPEWEGDDAEEHILSERIVFSIIEGESA